MNEINDPIADEIVKEATAIRVLCGNSDSFPDGYTVGQLNRMIADIQNHVERILSLAGVADVEQHYLSTLDRLTGEASGPNMGYDPYSETEN